MIRTTPLRTTLLWTTLLWTTLLRTTLRMFRRTGTSPTTPAPSKCLRRGPPRKTRGLLDPSPSLLDQGGAAAVGPLGPAGGGLLTDAERRVNDALAEASRALANDYSAQTQRSVAVVDDAIINYDAVERLIARIIETEKLEGPSALTPPPIAGKEPKETGLGLGAVLVFMPGQFEITKPDSESSSSPGFWTLGRFWCCLSTARSAGRTSVGSSSGPRPACARSSSPRTSRRPL